MIDGGSSPLTRGKRLRRAWALTLQGLIPAHAGKTFAPVGALKTGEAHPRSRGENLNVALDGGGHEGSSPLTRGKLMTRRRVPVKGGLIPAHAGKTGESRWLSGRGRAHPRSRGENPAPTRTFASALGSSPLTRGKHHEQAEAATRLGLIPAHAGKTAGTRSEVPIPRAHPRSRGENGRRP